MIIDLSEKPTQQGFGDVVGIGQSAVSELLSRGFLRPGGTIGEWVIDYCAHLREVAAGRVGSGELDLVTERARLAKEQADKVAMQNAVTRGELTPTIALEEVLTGAAAKIAGILDAIPGMIRRRVPQLSAADIETIAGEVAKARNTVAGMSLKDLVAESGDESATSSVEFID